MIRIFPIVKLCRLNLMPRVSQYILLNVDSIRPTANDERKNFTRARQSTIVKPLPGMAERLLFSYRFYNYYKSQRKRYKMLLAMSLPTLILNFLDIEKPEEEPEVITSIKRSVLLIQKGEYEKAEQMLHIALRQAQTIQHYDAVTYIYDVMANLAFDTEDYPKAQMLFVSVLQRLLSNGVTEDDFRVIHISLKMAVVFANQKEIEKAEQGFRFCMENLKLHIEKNPDDTLPQGLLGMTFDEYAQMLFSQSRYTEAHNYFLQAYDICKKVNSEKYELTANLLNNLGSVSYMQGEYDEAIKYYSAAAKIGDKDPDMFDLAVIHVNLGNVFLTKNLYNKAKKSCQAGRIIAKKRGDKDTLLKAEECLEYVNKALSSKKSN